MTEDARVPIGSTAGYEVPAPAPRGAIALTRDRNFGPYFFGKLFSNCGMWVQNIAAAFFMFELSGSAFMVGAVSIVQFAPQVLLALWSGLLNDRFDRRKLLMMGRVISTGGVAFLAIRLALTGEADFGGPAILLAGVMVTGVGLAFSAPAMMAIVPGLVEDRDLEQALALSAAGPSMGRTIGPAVGAGVLAIGGPALAFAVAAVGHSVFIVVLLFVRERREQRLEGRSSSLGGFRWLLFDRATGWLVLGSGVVGFAADPVITLAPALADGLGGGSSLVGVFASAFGIGALTLVTMVSRVRRVVDLETMGVAGLAGLVVGWLMVSASPAVWLTTAGFLTAGLGFMGSTVALNTIIHRRVPDELRGRVMALWGVAFLGSRPVAAAINGALADLVTIEVALVATAAITALMAVKVHRL